MKDLLTIIAVVLFFAAFAALGLYCSTHSVKSVVVYTSDGCRIIKDYSNINP